MIFNNVANNLNETIAILMIHIDNIERELILVMVTKLVAHDNSNHVDNHNDDLMRPILRRMTVTMRALIIVTLPTV